MTGALASAALCVPAALLAGVVDAIAGGGGLVTLPALLAVGLPPQLAIGTNKGQAVFGAVASFASFFRGRGIDGERAPLGFAMGFSGSLVGALALLAMRPEPLKPVVLGLLLFAAAVVLLRGHVVPTPRALLHPRLALAALALGLGAYDGFFGPGTGSLLIVGFAAIFGDSMTRASGNAKVVNLASNVAAVGLFAIRGVILWKVALPMAVANAAGAALGARFALARGDRLVRAVVLVVVSAVAAKLLVDMARG
jgi:uncharacterized membrane protein YfcA